VYDTPLRLPVVGTEFGRFRLPVTTASAAGALGAASGLLGEVTRRLPRSHSVIQIDPPATAIAVLPVVILPPGRAPRRWLPVSPRTAGTRAVPFQ